MNYNTFLVNLSQYTAISVIDATRPKLNEVLIKDVLRHRLTIPNHVY